MEIADDQRMYLLTQVAQMYYEQSVTQEVIATSLQVSRPTVSRLLKEAREAGVVQITIHSPFRYVASLETALTRAFPHLHQVKVVRTKTMAGVARAAAALLGSICRDGDIVGVSWGNTMAELTVHLGQRPLQGAKVVQLNGGVAQPGAGTNAHEIVSRFGQALGAEVNYLHVPAIVDSVHVRDALLQNRETAGVLNLGRRANVAVFGIGVPDRDSVLVKAGYFTPEYVDALRHKGAVGDICSQYFTLEGAPCDAVLNARTIGIPLAELSDRPNAVAVVAGRHKAASTLGALRGRFMNVLVIDEATAQDILRLNEEGGLAHD
jgi:deoxyribonucleoside regulator